jgi:hypothetical protein
MLLVITLGLVRVAAAQEAIPPIGSARTLPGAEAAPAAPGEAKAEHATEHAPEHTEMLDHTGECDFCTDEHGEEGRFFFDAEYLLWTPHRRNLDFAINDPINNGLIAGPVESVFPQTDSGVRTGGGWRIGDHGWAVAAYYTYFYSASVRTVGDVPGGTLYSTLSHPGLVDMVDTAVGDYRLKYQVADIEVGKNIAIGEDGSLWVSAGGRYAWINQALNASYDGQTAFVDRVSSPIDFEGYGIRVGGEARWNIEHGFGLYARAYGSLMSGYFRTSLTETNNAGAAQLTNIEDDFRKIVPVAELGVGLTWHWENVHALVGYEMTDWVNLVDSPDIVHDFSNKLSHRVSDLSLEGLTVRLSVGY